MRRLNSIQTKLKTFLASRLKYSAIPNSHTTILSLHGLSNKGTRGYWLKDGTRFLAGAALTMCTVLLAAKILSYYSRTIVCPTISHFVFLTATGANGHSQCQNTSNGSMTTASAVISSTYSWTLKHLANINGKIQAYSTL